MSRFHLRAQPCPPWVPFARRLVSKLAYEVLSPAQHGELMAFAECCRYHGAALDPSDTIVATQATAVSGAWEERARSERPAMPARRMIAGRYEILRGIGAGCYGQVYAAFDTVLTRTVALKVMDGGEWEGGEQQLARCRAEARALAQISHPNIVAVHDVGETENGVYIAMEYVEGADFSLWLMQRERSWDEICRVLLQAARGLSAAHQAGIVHRDFKPANILVGHDGTAKVADFGLAYSDDDPNLASAQDAYGSSSMATAAPRDCEVDFGETLGHESGGYRYTRASVAPNPDTGGTGGRVIVGTPAYMSPEQAEGRGVDARSDQFSFCVTMAEALWGRRLFIRGVRCEPPRKITNMRVAQGHPPQWVRRMLERGMSLRPEERFESMQALLDAWRRAARRQRRMVARIIAGVGACAIAVSAWYLARNEGRETACSTPQALLAGLQLDMSAPDLSADTTNFQAATWPRVSQRLVRYADRWADLRYSTCISAQVEGVVSQEMRDLRYECFDRGARVVRAVHRRMRNDPEQLAHADKLLRSLPDLRACENSVYLQSSMLQPADPEARERLAGLRQSLADVRVDLSLGDHESASASLADFTAEIEDFGFPPLSVEYELVAAERLQQTDPKLAVSRLREAATKADALALDELRADAWLAAAKIYARGLEHPELAAMGTSLARSAYARAGIDAHGRPQYSLVEGYFEMARNDYNAAAAAFARARSAFAASHPEGIEGPEAIDAVSGWMAAQWQLRQYDAVDQAMQQTEAIVRDQLGPDHPLVGRLLQNLSTRHYYRGDLDQAVHIAGKARDLAERSFGGQSKPLARALLTLAQYANIQGRHDDAGELAQRALDMFGALIEGGAQSALEARRELGESQWLGGRESDALESFEFVHAATYGELRGARAKSTAAQLDPRDVEMYLSVTAQLVEIRSHRGESRRALELVTRARKLVPPEQLAGNEGAMLKAREALARAAAGDCAAATHALWQRSYSELRGSTPYWRAQRARLAWSAIYYGLSAASFDAELADALPSAEATRRRAELDGPRQKSRRSACAPR